MMQEKLVTIILDHCTRDNIYRSANILAIALQLGSYEHATDAVSLWLTLKAGGNKISIASVYRILQWLTIKGLVLRQCATGKSLYTYCINPAVITSFSQNVKKS